MSEIVPSALIIPSETPQCKYFVVRKKRLCRMTVKPGRQYCGEHEPEPRIEEGKDDTRIPCPYDSKHTCYKSKLEKHLSICNARQDHIPEYIVQDINAPEWPIDSERRPLAEIPWDVTAAVIEKVNRLYEQHLQGNINLLQEQPIHPVIENEFNELGRTESSRRHLRQSSSLMRVAEDAGVVKDGSCYVELGAGKGRLSYYVCTAWCGAATGSRAVAVDRAAHRHKRDNKVRERTVRIRADLRHLRLGAAAGLVGPGPAVGLAKHLCGEATDFALRCISNCPTARALVLATCCHHRCARAHYVANQQLMDLGITGDDFNVMLGIVSWATCGDGRSRNKRQTDTTKNFTNDDNMSISSNSEISGSKDHVGNLEESKPKEELAEDELNEELVKSGSRDQKVNSTEVNNLQECKVNKLSVESREMIGRKAKALLDWGRILYLRSMGFNARLCFYVPTSVSLENVCIIATKG